jgi:hypothetical protein
MNITQALTDDRNNESVTFHFYGQPTQVNLITPAKVIMFHYDGKPNDPNVKVTNKQVLSATTATTYVASTAYLSASDFQYQHLNDKFDSSSLQMTIKCESLDSASTIYFLFFINNGVNSTEMGQHLTKFIGDALNNQNNSDRTYLELTQSMFTDAKATDIRQNTIDPPDIAYFSQKHPTVGNIKYYLCLRPIVASFKIQNFGSLKNVDSQLLQIYAPPKQIYKLLQSYMNKARPTGTSTTVARGSPDSFVGFHDGMIEGFSAPTDGSVETNLNYDKDIVGKANGVKVDPNGGTTMFYGEDMICEESAINKTNINFTIQKDPTVNYVVIALIICILAFLFLFGVPYLLETIIKEAFRSDGNTSSALIVLATTALFKNIFWLISLGLRGSKSNYDKNEDKRTADETINSISGFYHIIAGIGGTFTDHYGEKKDKDGNNKYYKIENRINPSDEKFKAIDDISTDEPMTLKLISGKQPDSVKKYSGYLSSIVLSMLGFITFTFFWIAFGLFFSATNSSISVDANMVANINKPVVIGGIFVCISWFVIMASALAYIMNPKLNRIQIGGNKEILYNGLYGFLFVPQGLTYKSED